MYTLRSSQQGGGLLDFMDTDARSGRPVPVPPQLLHAIRPEPAQVWQPTSPSDHREHRHATRPVPLHVAQRFACHPPAIGFSCSMADFTSMAPASTPRPVASCEAITKGPIVLLQTPSCCCVYKEQETSY